MALTGARAQALLSEVLDRIQPHLPAGVRVELHPYKKWTTLTQGTAVGGYHLTVRSVGAFAFLPRRIRAKVTSQEALETVLEVAYWVPGMGRGDQDFDVRAVVNGEVVFVSYRPPGADERVQLPPIPLHLL